MNNVNSLIIHLDSRHATHYLENDSGGNPLTTNYTYTLVEGLPIPDSKMCEISLYTATIPFSFYNVRPNINDKFTIKIVLNNGDAPNTTHEETFTILAGNYSATALKNQFTTLQKLATNDNIKNLDFTITYQREYIKFNLAMNKDIGNLLSLEVRFDNCASMFGFRKDNIFHSFVGANTSRVLNSEICVDISDSIHGLYIRQNLASKSTLDNEAGTFSNILTRIPINTNPGGIIFHTPANSTHRALTSIQAIQTIGIKLTDDRNRSIDLNGLHFQISLMITLVDKVDIVPELTKYTRRKNELYLHNQMVEQQQKQKQKQPTKKKKKRKSKKKK